MSYILNKDAKFKIGGRNIARLTKQEFIEKVKEWCIKYNGSEKNPDWNNHVNTNPPSDSELLETLAFFIASSGSHEEGIVVANDFKELEFSNENVETIGDIRMTNSGCPYVVAYSGGDWENPVCFIIYFDGKQIRAFLPKCGNTWRTYTEYVNKKNKSGKVIVQKVTKKIALGNDEDEDTLYAQDNLFKTGQIPFGYTLDWDDIHEIEPDYDLCISEFLARVGESNP